MTDKELGRVFVQAGIQERNNQFAFGFPEIALLFRAIAQDKYSEVVKLFLYVTKKVRLLIQQLLCSKGHVVPMNKICLGILFRHINVWVTIRTLQVDRVICTVNRQIVFLKCLYVCMILIELT